MTGPNTTHCLHDFFDHRLQSKDMREMAGLPSTPGSARHSQNSRSVSWGTLTLGTVIGAVLGALTPPILLWLCGLVVEVHAR